MRLGSLPRRAMKRLFESRAGQGKPPRLAVFEHRGALVSCWTEASAPRRVLVSWCASGALVGVLSCRARSVADAQQQIAEWRRSCGG